MENTLTYKDIIKEKDDNFILSLPFQTEEETLYLIPNIDTLFTNFILVTKEEFYEYLYKLQSKYDVSEQDMLSYIITKDLEEHKLNYLKKRIFKLVLHYCLELKVKNNTLYFKTNDIEKINSFFSQKQNSSKENEIIYISNKLKEKSIKI